MVKVVVLGIYTTLYTIQYTAHYTVPSTGGSVVQPPLPVVRLGGRQDGQAPGDSHGGAGGIGLLNPNLFHFKPHPPLQAPEFLTSTSTRSQDGGGHSNNTEGQEGGAQTLAKQFRAAVGHNLLYAGLG